MFLMSQKDLYTVTAMLSDSFRTIQLLHKEMERERASSSNDDAHHFRTLLEDTLARHMPDLHPLLALRSQLVDALTTLDDSESSCDNDTTTMSENEHANAVDKSVYVELLKQRYQVFCDCDICLPRVVGGGGGGGKGGGAASVDWAKLLMPDTVTLASAAEVKHQTTTAPTDLQLSLSALSTLSVLAKQGQGQGNNGFIVKFHTNTFQTHVNGRQEAKVRTRRNANVSVSRRLRSRPNVKR
jgi:hypothetical protein